MNTSPPISIVVRTSNSEKSVRRLLSALKLSPGDEVIVVDTESKDGTVAAAGSGGARVIHSSNPFNYSRTLNLGFGAARNEWILALSSHCEPMEADFLDRYREALAELSEAPAVIYGSVVMSRAQYQQRIRRDPKIGSFGARGNANALYSRKDWLNHPFDESLPTGEDGMWMKWAKEEGLVCAQAPTAAVIYRHEGGLAYRFRKGYGEVRVQGAGVTPITLPQLGIAIAQATRRFLWDEHAVRQWCGQVAHQLGAFIASRTRGAER